MVSGGTNAEPECNAPIALADGSWIRADFLWRRHGLIVEADPRGTHDRTTTYRSDRRRDREVRRLHASATMT